MSTLSRSSCTGAELATVPLRVLAGRSRDQLRGRVVARSDPEPGPPSRALADRWGQSRLVRCHVCHAPVRPAVWDAVGALLGDVDPTPPVVECLWHGPEGVGRAHPPTGPVPVCVLAPWQLRPVK